MATKLNFPFTSNDVVLTEVILDEKYVEAVARDVGADAMPSRASKPSSVYRARVRHWSFTSGKPGKPCVALMDFDVTLKRDVEPVNPAGLFPGFGAITGTQCAWMEGGKLAARAVGKTEVVDLPPGALAGGTFVSLSPGLRIDRGRFGLAPPKDLSAGFAAGTRFHARFLIGASRPDSPSGQTEPVFEKDPQGWLQAMGLAGDMPYTIQMSRGRLEEIAFVARMVPESSGVAGAVTREAEIPFDVPLEIRDMNPNWPAGIWQEGRPVAYAGVFETTAWPRLNVSCKGRFYAGNLLVAENRDLVLEIIHWTKDRIRIEAHNSTAAAIETTVSTPKEMDGLKPFQQKVSVPAGTTACVEG
jgi:hypothetical protein